MILHKLIINPSGLLSACPTAEEFSRGNYLTEQMILADVLVDYYTLADLWQNRDHAYILPYAQKLPVGSRYFTVIGADTPNAFLYASPVDQVDEGYDSLTADACIYPFCKE